MPAIPLRELRNGGLKEERVLPLRNGHSEVSASYSVPQEAPLMSFSRHGVLSDAEATEATGSNAASKEAESPSKPSSRAARSNKPMSRPARMMKRLGLEEEYVFRTNFTGEWESLSMKEKAREWLRHWRETLGLSRAGGEEEDEGKSERKD
eukprot:3825057-Rhodomonas_salina.1